MRSSQVPQGRVPGGAPGPGQFLSPGSIQAARGLQSCQFAISCLAAATPPEQHLAGPWAFPVPMPTPSRAAQRAAAPACASAPVGAVRECPHSRKCWREPRPQESLPCRHCFFSALEYFQCWSGLTALSSSHPNRRGWLDII